MQNVEAWAHGTRNEVARAGLVRKTTISGKQQFYLVLVIANKQYILYI